MGNARSGNRSERPGRKKRVEECNFLDVDLLAKDGILQEGHTERTDLIWGETFTATIDANAADLDHAQVQLWFVPPGAVASQETHQVFGVVMLRLRFGGLRWLLVCDCGRRARRVYLPPSAEHFGCRTCHNLAYASSCRSHHVPALERALAERNGWDPRQMRKVLVRAGLKGRT
jgi:hypothetical protein